ncbi:hypothetical protein QE152_g27191 [Popillia japonica]|uniref:Uncharacterized protein n=1 Tax=Popillia japonica TaxID=7064 RepID=A0AAW1JVM2_POPJA
MTTTCHGAEITNSSTRIGEKMKPNAVIDYNNTKKETDIADQLSSYHSSLRKSLRRYKKVAIDLLFRVAIQENLSRHYLGQTATPREQPRPPAQEPRNLLEEVTKT